MKTLKCFMMVVLAVCLASCGGKKSSDSETSFDVTVDNTTIGGKLSQYFSLEDKTYKYEKGIIDKVTVELKCIEPLPENLKAYIGVEVLDENGTVICAGKADAWSFDDFDVLRQATPGQVVTITVDNHEKLGDNTPAKIRLSSIVEEDTEPSESSSSSESSDDSSVSSDDSDDSSVSSDDSSDDDKSTSRSSTASADWDSMLNSYEQYVNKYIALVKKASNGDMTAMAEYAGLMQKAQELSDKMNGAQGEMSASQWARYMKITTKMTKAAQEMR